MNPRQLSYLVIFSWFILSCQIKSEPGPFDHIQDETVKSILIRAVDKAGGYDAWKSIRQIRYTKSSTLYQEDGYTESHIIQQHRYWLRPDLRGEITWEEDGQNHKIFYSGKESYKLIAGKKIPDSQESAKEAFLSAYYVLFILFKILDPGTQLTYEGTDTLENGSVVDVIRAGYTISEYENHSTNNTWWYYFGQDDGSYLASMVFHAPTYAFIRNNEFTDEFPIRFNTYRKSWRVDSLRNKQFLRGEFYYEEFKME